MPPLTIIYSVSTNFCLELIDPFAREVEGQQFFSSDAVLSLVRLEPCSNTLLSTRRDPKIYLSSLWLYKLRAIISGHAVAYILNLKSLRIAKIKIYIC